MSSIESARGEPPSEFRHATSSLPLGCVVEYRSTNPAGGLIDGNLAEERRAECEVDHTEPKFIVAGAAAAGRAEALDPPPRNADGAACQPQPSSFIAQPAFQIFVI